VVARSALSTARWLTDLVLGYPTSVGMAGAWYLMGATPFLPASLGDWHYVPGWVLTPTQAVDHPSYSTPEVPQSHVYVNR
jgi:hypothetical protein